MLSAGINMVGFSWITSPAATELEMIVRDWLAKLLKLPDDFLSTALFFFFHTLAPETVVLQVISVMFVGHLGELPLSGASIATSFASVIGFSLLAEKLLTKTLPYPYTSKKVFEQSIRMPIGPEFNPVTAVGALNRQEFNLLSIL
ncbi:Tryptophan decarboxylase 2 [Camellia lanceoleosa]|uniref:Tryptophan decarboxylase 2 n=1 Tax=Camellia lanceoleosa TaxID=1840588 RepID=A0ACC0HEJ9_9ERIC|nr:Tryptophan decarboxylase 2 [Camellia lanceoleosa]